MKKRIASVLFALALVLGAFSSHANEVHAASGVKINTTTFPDKIFRDYVSENFDTDGNGYLSREEREEVYQINVSGLGISNLKGVERFTQIGTLNCSGNSLKSLDVSNNPRLHTIICSENKLASLTLGEKENLNILD